MEENNKTNFKDDEIDYLNEHLSELDIIDDPTKEYKRSRLIPTKKELGCFNFEEIKKVLSDKNISKDNIVSHIDFYHYNCESIEDYGWGCAWRCIQMLISSAKVILNNEKVSSINNSFENIFTTYGKRETLDNIYLKLNGLDVIPEYLANKKYAPFETEYGWGEPFIAQLIFHDLTGIKGDLFLLNSYPNAAYAPVEVFNNKIHNFEAFKNLLIDNFKKDKPFPVIIDDSLVTLMIVGVRVDGDVVSLVILDPHVVEPKLGIYNVNFDKEGNYDPENNEETKNGKRFKMKVGAWMVYMISTN
jgi:hypothetical protein